MRAFASGVGLIPEQDWEFPNLAASPYGTDPTLAQTLTGLIPGVTYQLTVQVQNVYPQYGSAGDNGFVPSLDSEHREALTTLTTRLEPVAAVLKHAALREHALPQTVYLSRMSETRAQ